MGLGLKKWGIYRFSCDLDGKIVKVRTGDSSEVHFFLVLSHEAYNRWSHYYLGMGLSSKISNQSHYVTLSPEHFESYSGVMSRTVYYSRLSGGSVTVLIDKICRVHSDCLEKVRLPTGNDVLTLSEAGVSEIKRHINFFLDIPSDDPNR